MNSNPVPQLPKQSDVEWRLLKLLSGRSIPIETQNVYNQLALQFELSQLQRSAMDPNSGRNAWKLLVRRAKQRLAGEGLLYCPAHGMWLLTELGEKRANASAADLDS